MTREVQGFRMTGNWELTFTLNRNFGVADNSEVSNSSLQLSWTVLPHYRRESGGTRLFAR